MTNFHNMSDIENSLLPGESIQYKGQLHPIVFLKGALIAVWSFLLILNSDSRPIGLCFLAIAAIVLFKNFINFISAEFTITNKRVVIRRGWLRRRSWELFHARIESVSVGQGMLPRMLNYGSLRIRGIGGTVGRVRNLAAPLEFRHQVQLLTETK